jgi:hypothetical protein
VLTAIPSTETLAFRLLEEIGAEFDISGAKFAASPQV